MRILYISHKPIYPKLDGGCVAMANFLDLLLANDNEVKHLTIETNKHPFNSSNYPTEIVEKTKAESVFINSDIHPFKALKALFSSGSYNVNRFYSDEMDTKIIATLSASEFDTIILESLFCTPYLETIRAHFKRKVHMRSHNVEFKIWEDLTANCNNLIKKVYLKKLTKDLKRYEIDLIKELDGIMTISESDEKYLKTATSIPISTIPFTVAANATLTNDYSACNLFHVGGMDWEPNRQAVERLIQLLPSIIHRNPKIELSLFGKGTENLGANNANIHAEGFVEDLESQAIKKGILVSPISSGSGIRIKILEMMALGIPTITTKKGAQGINYEEHNCLVIAETNQEIINACVNLSQDKTLRFELGSNAINYISTYHSPNTVAKQLDEFLQST